MDHGQLEEKSSLPKRTTGLKVSKLIPKDKIICIFTFDLFPTG